RRPREAVGAERQRKRRRNAFDARDAEPALLEEMPKRLERVQARVRQIENASFAVIEPPEQRLKADDDERDVAGGDDEPGTIAAAACTVAQRVEKPLG